MPGRGAPGGGGPGGGKQQRVWAAWPVGCRPLASKLQGRAWQGRVGSGDYSTGELAARAGERRAGGWRRRVQLAAAANGSSQGLKGHSRWRWGSSCGAGSAHADDAHVGNCARPPPPPRHPLTRAAAPPLLCRNPATPQEFKGYVFKIMGGQDKQGFPMKQGVLTNGRVQVRAGAGQRPAEHIAARVVVAAACAVLACFSGGSCVLCGTGTRCMPHVR